MTRCRWHGPSWLPMCWCGCAPTGSSTGRGAGRGPRSATQVRGGLQACGYHHPRPTRWRCPPWRPSLRHGPGGGLAGSARQGRGGGPAHPRASPGGAAPGQLKPPGPLWLAWIGGELPEHLLLLWTRYCLRFTVEHGFRLLKQDLGWTTVRPGAPAAADRWTWLLALGWWMLWLARALVGDQRLGLGAPPGSGDLDARTGPPGASRDLSASVAPRPGRPDPAESLPGRQLGAQPGPRERHKVAHRDPKRAA